MTTQFNRLDLNLLRVFDAVMEERSVLRAAQRICLSQSAVSHALARLREMLDDELFVRTAMEFTVLPLPALIGRPRRGDKRFNSRCAAFHSSS